VIPYSLIVGIGKFFREIGGVLAELREQFAERVAGLPRWARWLSIVGFVAIGALVPLLFSTTSGFMNATILALAYVVMALGLNVVVGFAGLLDLGYAPNA
jgi:ABC-type branched-subunit amino acid transport system permease subunit